MKHFLRKAAWLFLAAMPFAAFGQITVTVGSGTSAASTNALLSTSTTGNKYSRTATVYSAADILSAGGIAGTINKIRYYKDGSGEYQFNDAFLEVYIKPWPTTTIQNYPIVWATEVTGATLVYSTNTLGFTLGQGWQELTLSTPYFWNGTDNLMIMVDFYRPSTPTGSITWQYTSVTSTNATQVSSSLPTTMANGDDNRPNIQFEFTSNISDDAGVFSIDSVYNKCAGSTVDVYATLSNSGNNAIDSVLVNWELNGVLQTPVMHNSSYNSGQFASVMLGSFTLAASTLYDIKVWTSNPNNTSDSNNANDTLLLSGLQSSLSGPYTLGGSGADFANFNDALNALNLYGVCGPVVFNVASGTYTEQLQLGPVMGVSSANTVTFQSATGDSTDVTLTHTASGTADNFVISMNAASYFTFKELKLENPGTSYGRVIFAEGGSIGNTFTNCIIQGDTANTSTSTNKALIYSTNGQDNDNTFSHNIIRGGSYGLYWDGAGTTTLESGTLVEYNLFLDNYSYGSRLYYQDAPVFRYNTLVSNSTASTPDAFNFYYCDNALEVTGNQVKGTLTGYGLYFSNCEATASARGVVSNNFVRRGDPTSTSTTYGIYLTGSDYLDIVHNNVLIESNSTSGRALYITSGGNNYVANNNLVNLGPGYGFYLGSTASVSASDYNNIYAPNGNVGYSGGAQSTLAAWQSQTSFDANSLSVDPDYGTGDDLHTCSEDIYGAGTVYAGVTVDIDGDIRPVPPTIGADEFISLQSFMLEADTSVCPGDSLIVGTGSSLLEYQWNTNDSTPSILILTPGTYWVDVTNGCNTISDTITVIHEQLAAASFTNSVNGFDVTFQNTSLGSGLNFVWDFGDGNTSNDTSPTHTFTTSGSHDVMLIATGPCNTDTFTMQIVLTFPGIAGYEHIAALNLYPNPAQGMLNLSFNAAVSGQAVIRVTDMNGKLVKHQQIRVQDGQNQHQLQIEGLDAGMYLLYLEGNDGRVMKKFVVQ